MEFMTFFEAIMIIVYGNILFEDRIFKYFKQMIPLCLGLVFLNKYVLSKAPSIAIIIIVLIIIISLVIISKKDILDCVIQIMLGYIVMCFSEVLASLVMGIITVYVANSLNAISLIVLFVFWGLLVKILTKIPNYKYKILNNRIEEKKLIIGILIILLLLMMLIKPFYDNNFLTGIIGIEIVTYLTLIFILSYNIYGLMAKEITMKNKLELENNFKPILEEYVDKLKASEHEYKNHLNAIYTMVEVCNEKEIKQNLKKYIGQIKSNDNLSELLYINNTILKAILYSKISQAEQIGIKVTYSLRSSFNNISISDTDLVIILSNLMNNSIEAVENEENPWIDIKIEEFMEDNKNRYSINIINSVKDIDLIDVSKIIMKGYTTKESSRGYGLYNIKQIIKKVSGNLMIEPMDESISITVIF